MNIWVVETFEKEEWMPALQDWNGLSGTWRTRKYAEDAMKEMKSCQPIKYYDIKYRVAEYIRKD
ncbi:hypothetical protein LCGC14_0548720 [marine sediment metagenome]|uniref:Uncharacterized protein n=1 Tax=marine sediment metagenome TaxID=412755 RepID=A0A0F9S965_9ZZZZ